VKQRLLRNQPGSDAATSLEFLRKRLQRAITRANQLHWTTQYGCYLLCRWEHILCGAEWDVRHPAACHRALPGAYGRAGYVPHGLHPLIALDIFHTGVTSVWKTSSAISGSVSLAHLSHFSLPLPSVTSGLLFFCVCMCLSLCVLHKLSFIRKKKKRSFQHSSKHWTQKHSSTQNR